MTMKRPADDGKRKLVQDWTGHVTMNSEQSRVYMHSVERDSAINGMRKSGTLVFKPNRNPLRAEVTPRRDYKGFDYNPPPAIPVPERWKYPETDWGLMLKFDSQKSIYMELEETAKRCENNIREFKNKKSLLEQMENNQSNSIMNTQREMTDTMKSARDTGRVTGRKDGSGDASASASQTLTSIPEHTQRDHSNTARVSVREGDAVDALVRDMKTLKALRSQNHPELLEKTRAERAAEFIKQQKHAMEPPTVRDLPGEGFRPGGGCVNMERIRQLKNQRQAELKQKKNSGSKGGYDGGSPSSPAAAAPLDTHRLKEQLGSLLEDLSKTEAELNRQTLKIALKNKTRNYEK